MEIQQRYLPHQAKFKAKGITPSAEQLAIQCATQREILIQANAGAAKTTTLALRIAESLVRGVQAEQVLALAITPAARDVLRERLHEIGVSSGLIKRLTITTFEEFARACLQNLEGGECIYLEDEQQLREVAIESLENVCAMHGRHFEVEANFTNLAIHQFLQMQVALKSRLTLHTRDFGDYSFEEIAHVLDISMTQYCWHVEFERIRGADDIPEFRAAFDASYDLARLLLNAPERANQLPSFSCILCDELHDLNEVCFRLLTSLIARGNAFFCAAGDKDQIIYSWRGAEHQFMRQRFQQTYPRLQEYPLTASYRYGENLARAVGVFKNKASSSALAQASSILTLAYRDEAECGAQVLAEIQAWLANGGKLGQIAILLRSPSQSVALESLLLQAHLSYKTEGMVSFLRRKEVLILRGMVAIALQNLELVKLRQAKEDIFEAMIEYAEIAYDAEEYAGWQKSRQEALNQANALEWFFDGVLQRKSSRSGEAMRQAVQYVRAQTLDANAGQVLQEVFRIMQLDSVARRIYVDREQAAFITETLQQFIAMCSTSGMNLQEFSDWLGEAEWRVAQKAPKEALLLACVDAIKGHEYPCVILPYLQRKAFPRPEVPLLEEENRFYVAITRSQQRLVLLKPQEPEQQSPFLARLHARASN
ncbi:MAG: ATP-dependent helicase [Burkholderiales bacterium]|nr:ATP-dependent helicase [Burkholderiales bacterium]